MNRESEARLIDFCAHQKGAFQESAWLDSQIVSRDEMAVVCHFLGGVDWYGHRQRLAMLADHLIGSSGRLFAELVSQVNFDPARFSNMLRRKMQHA